MSTIARQVGLVRFLPRPAASVRLLCIPFAGGGAAAFRPWAVALPESVELLAAQFPGRESRISERVLTTVDAMVEELRVGLETYTDLPFAILGHSMGALVAFELAQALRSSGMPAPVQLFVSGSRPPRLRDDGMPPLHVLSNDDLVNEVDRRYGGVPAVVREQRDLMEMLLPMLRGDLTAFETYHPRSHAPLACPISAFAGARDPRATPEAMEGWRAETSGAFKHRTFDGDHFFINAHRPAVIAEILASLIDSNAREGVA